MPFKATSTWTRTVPVRTLHSSSKIDGQAHCFVHTDLADVPVLHQISDFSAMKGGNVRCACGHIMLGMPHYRCSMNFLCISAACPLDACRLQVFFAIYAALPGSQAVLLSKSFAVIAAGWMFEGTNPFLSWYPYVVGSFRTTTSHRKLSITQLC